MKKFFLLFFLLPIMLIGQNEFDNWHFGYGVSMSFKSGSAVLTGTSSIYHNEGSATVSDCEGNLLFYTDGNTVWNKNGNVMANGTGLYASSTGVLTVPSTQGALIVKRPETAGIYYIFTSSDSRGLNYSTVNMNANGGLGEVIIKNTLLSSQGTQKLAVTYHSNGTDIWVATHYNNNNQYDAFLVTKTGVNSTPVTSFDGPNHQDGHGDLKFSQDGKKIAAAIDFRGRLYLGDFNNSTGKVTNTASIGGLNDPHGVEFSPDGTKMYTNSTTEGLLQFQVSSSNNASTLSSYTRVTSASYIYGSLQLAPDGKIYVANAGESYLGVISNPNGVGFSSNFSLQGFYIGNGASGYEVTNATLITPNSFNGPNSVNYAGGCLGDITQFTLGNTSDIVDILWNFGDPGSGLYNYSTQLAPSHEYKTSGTYNVSVTITYLCGSETINVPVLISPAPKVDLNPNQNLCSGIPANIGIAAEANVVYSWSPTTGLSNPNSSNPTLTLFGNPPFQDFVYTLVATNSVNGCSVSDQTKIRLRTAVADAGPDTTVCSGDKVMIGTDSLGNHTYSWSPTTYLDAPTRDKTNVEYNNLSNIEVALVYTVTANYNGCLATDDVVVRFKPMARVQSPRDTTICSLDSVVLNQGGNPLASYIWSSTEGLSSTTAVSPLFSMSNKDTGVVSYTKYVEISFDGCTNFDTIKIAVNPQAGIDPYQYLCPGFGAQLTPYGKGVSYLWTPNQNISSTTASNPTVNPLVSLWYFLQVTDQYNCTYNDSVFVDVNPIVPVKLGPDTSLCRNDSVLIGSVAHPQNAIYSWSPNVFISHPDSNYTYVFPDSTKQYIITTTSDTCKGRDTILVKVNQLPLVVLKGDTTICNRDTITIVASGAEKYVWSPLTSIFIKNDSALIYPSDSIKYFVSGTDTNGCTNFDSAMINVKPLPQINLTPNVSVCITDSVQVIAQGGGAYSWTPANLTSNASIANPYLIPTVDTRFIVEVLGNNNCTDWDTVDVKVNPLPNIKLTSDTTICEGTKAQLWASGGISYSWSPSTNLNNSNIARPVSSTTVPIQYQVTVIDGNACIDSAQVAISINVTPESKFDYTFTPSCPGFDTKFADKSVNADQWFWVFGDGGSSQEPNPSHIYEFGKSVKTYLITGNNKLCYDTLSIDLNWKKLEDFVDIYAPNVITPNGDKINDCFDYSVEGDFELCTNLQVFNRWGMKVYDSLDSKTCFQGINEYNFQALPSGTYFYTLSINDYNKNGFITVVADQ